MSPLWSSPPPLAVKQGSGCLLERRVRSRSALLAIWPIWSGHGAAACGGMRRHGDVTPCWPRCHWSPAPPHRRFPLEPWTGASPRTTWGCLGGATAQRGRACPVLPRTSPTATATAEPRLGGAETSKASGAHIIRRAMTASRARSRSVPAPFFGDRRGWRRPRI